MGYNILKLNRYNYDFFNCEEVVFFEYIVVKGMAFKKKKEFFANLLYSSANSDLIRSYFQLLYQQALVWP